VPRPTNWTPVAALAFATVLGSLSYRAFGTPPAAYGSEGWLLHDFWDTVYYPARALLDGHNPWDTAAYMRAYPADKPFPAFAPFSLALWAPIAYLPAATAGRVWFALSALLTVVVAWVALRIARGSTGVAAVLGVSAAMLASRPGHSNLLLGQQTLVVVLGIYAALLYARSRPWLAALGVVASTIKPQFGVPLVILLVAAGHVRVAAYGVVASGLASLAVLSMMPGSADAGSLGVFLSAVRGSASRIDQSATTWWGQVDFRYLLHHLQGGVYGPVDAIAAALLLAAGAWMVRRTWRRDRPGDDELTIALACLTILLSLYHQIYDVLLLTLPLVLLVVRGDAPPWSSRPWIRIALISLLALPAVNYLATWSGLVRLGVSDGGPGWLVVTAVNAAALSFAWLLYAVTASRPAP
jgi:hypothetical protein